jgi:predicted amidohydrolase
MEFKKFKAATVQTSPVFLNVEKTVDKAISFIKEAASNQAKLIAFPEVFISGYPYWNWIMTPVQGSKWYEALYMFLDLKSRNYAWLLKKTIFILLWESTKEVQAMAKFTILI